MAGQVPYNPSPTVEPQGIPNDYQNINASPNAFGAQIGQQLEKTGNEFDQIAVQKAMYTNELYANDHSTLGMKALTGAWDAYGNLRGRAAHDALPQFQDQVEKIYHDYTDAAPNDQAKEMTARFMRQMSDRYLGMGENHAIQQKNVWADQSTKDHATELANQAALAVNQVDPNGSRVQMETLIEAGANQWRSYGQDHSLDQLSTNRLVAQYKGIAYQNIVGERVASGDLKTAQSIYASHADEMSAESRLATERLLKPALKSQARDSIVEQLWNGGGQTATGDDKGNLSQSTLDFIKGREGFAPIAKWDFKQNSGGYGSKAEPGQTYTKESAERDLIRDAKPVDDWLTSNVTVPLSPEQRTGLTSFGYNLGTGALDKLKGDINAGDFEKVAQRMQSFNHAGGQVDNGLTSRRQIESSLVLKTGGADGPGQQSGPPEQTATLARAAELTKADPALQTQVLSELRRRYANYKTENAVEINQLQAGIPDVIAQAKAGAYDGDIPEDRIRALFPQKQADKWIDDFQVAKRGGEMLRSAQWASPDDIQAMEQDLFSGTGVHSMQLRIARGKGTTGPGTTGAEPESAEDKASDFKERVQLAQQFEQFRKKRDDVLTGPNADPAVYVAPSPQVAPAYAKFREVEQAAQGKPPGSPEQNAAALAYQDYASKSLAMQAALGVPEGKRHLLAKDQATSLVAEITKPNSDPKSVMQGLDQTYGQSWPTISKDLAKLGGLPAPYQAIRTLDDQNASQLSEFLKSTTQSTEEKGNDPSKFKSPEKMMRELSADDKLITNIRNSVRSSTSVVKMDNSYRQMGRSEDFIDSVHQAVDYLAYAKQFGIGGAKSTNAANDAVSAFIDKFDFMDDPGQAMVPKDKIATVKESARNVVDALEEADVQTPASIANSGKAVPFSDIGERGRVGGLSPSHYFEAVKAAPTWKNLPDGSGLVLTDASVTGQMGRYVRDKDGNAIVVKFDAPLVPRSSKNIEEDNLPETRKAG